METINLFDVLGVDQNASMGEIKKAYRRLVFKYHPDHDASQAARKKFNRITRAYKVLADPVKRDEYLRGQSAAVTDEPWILLDNYWDTIHEKGLSG